MCLGTQLNALYSALKEDDGQASRRAFHSPLLINFLVGDGWRDGVYALKAESADVLTRSLQRQTLHASMGLVQERGWLASSGGGK